MSAIPTWRAGFELEVILGDLGEPRFERELREHGPMDEASSAFCRAFAALLRDRTGRSWSAPSGSPRRPGFHVVPEYGLDPLNWPEDRLAGVELLTPPLPLDNAETVRTELVDAIYEIDGDFNFFADEHTSDCRWHINIDAGDGYRLDPDRFIAGVDELLLLARNDRLFSRYTGLQRHAVGVPLLRHWRMIRPTSSCWARRSAACSMTGPGATRVTPPISPSCSRAMWNCAISARIRSSTDPISPSNSSGYRRPSRSGLATATPSNRPFAASFCSYRAGLPVFATSWRGI